jgi:hypothetical protein
MTQRNKHPNIRKPKAPEKDKPIGDSKAGGETPNRRFAGRRFSESYQQKGDIERPPFEGHPDHETNSGRPNRQSPGPETSGQHGQRPKREPHSG